MALIDSTTTIEKGDKCGLHKPVAKAVYSVFKDPKTGKRYIQIDTYGSLGRKAENATQSIQIEESLALGLLHIIDQDSESRGIVENNCINCSETKPESIDCFDNDILVVDYKPRFSSFFYRGPLHIEYNLGTDSLKFSGWDLSDNEVLHIKSFYRNRQNITDFFDDTKAYSTNNFQRVIDSGPYSLTYKWHGLFKSISVGALMSIPYENPFEQLVFPH